MAGGLAVGCAGPTHPVEERVPASPAQAPAPSAPGATATTAPIDRGVPSIEACAERLVGYAQWPHVTDRPWRLWLDDEANGSTLVYYGAIHSRDPDHPQVAEIEEAWGDLRPEVAFYEGPDRGIEPDLRSTVRTAGESGLVRFLARRDGAEVRRLEPDPVAEARYVMEVFTPEQTKLFYVLREAQRMRQSASLGKDAIVKRIASLLKRARSLPGIGEVLTTVPEVAAAYARHFDEPQGWWQAPPRWFDPLLTGEQTGGKFLNGVNRRSSEYRNLHMYRELAGAVREGKRVFAVVGRNHVPMQAPALRCAL